MPGVTGHQDCPLCEKHRGTGPLVGPVVYTDDLVHVAHRADGPPGYLFVDSVRHTPSLAALTDAEAVAVGAVVARLARALTAELHPASVHTFVAGLAVPHFHQHVLIRPPGTPESLPWWQFWPDAPAGDPADLASRLARRLRADRVVEPVGGHR